MGKGKTLTTGKCQFCGCTETRACVVDETLLPEEGGTCSWTDASQTACTACVKPGEKLESLKALSLLQPWADTILFLDKRIENRKKPTKHRGPVVIHISKGWDSEGEKFIRGLLFKGETLIDRDRRIDIRDADDFMDRARARRGGFAGLMVIQHCQPFAEGLGRWAFGPFCYLLRREVIRFQKLIPAKGQLGFWNIPAKLLEEAQQEAD